MKGFKIILGGRRYSVYFQDWNERVVKCTLEAELISEAPARSIFIGMAKCNIDEDEFDLKCGQMISMERALKKFSVESSNLLRDAEKKIMNICSSAENGITGKFNRIWDKAGTQ